MTSIRRMILALVVGGMAVAAVPSNASAEDWGRFYHYPYSYFPYNYRKPFGSKDFDLKYGYPMYPMYMSFPPYYRKDLYYPYLKHRTPGGSVKSHWQGNHFILDVF